MYRGTTPTFHFVLPIEAGTTLVSGYIPTASGNYYTEVAVFTGNGTFTVPENSKGKIRVVLVGGGAAEVTLSKDQLPAHAHTFLGKAHTHQGNINMSSLECSEAGGHQHKIDVYATRSTGKLARYAWRTGMFRDTSSSDDHLALDFSKTSPESSYYYTNSDTTEGTHTHTVSGNGTVEIAEATAGGTVGSTGSGQAHENRPPYYALCYIMKQ